MCCRKFDSEALTCDIPFTVQAFLLSVHLTLLIVLTMKEFPVENEQLLVEPWVQLPAESDLTVILVTFNKARYLNRSLSSMRHLVLSGVCGTILIVDDGSRDTPGLWVASMENQLNNRVIMYRNGKNRGTHMSRLTGVLLTQTKFLAFLDPDDQLVWMGVERALQVAIVNQAEIVEYACMARWPDGRIEPCWLTPPVHEASALEYRKMFFAEKTNWHLHRKVISVHLYKYVISTMPEWVRYKWLVRNEDRLQIAFLLNSLSSNFVYTDKVGELYFEGLADASASKTYQNETTLRQNNKFVQDAIFGLFHEVMIVR